MDAVAAALIQCLVAALPGVPEATIADAIAAVLRGESATLHRHTVEVSFGNDNRFDQATITLGDIAGGHIIKPIIVHLPHPIDPLPAALATFAAMPLDHIPVPTTILPPTSRIAFARNGQFVGREQDLMNLALAIAEPAPTVMVSVVAAGLGGIGKTSLAVEFVYRYAPYFAGGVFWLNCADPATIPSEVASCAGALGLSVANLDLAGQVAAVRRAWEEPIPRLLIFDNCEDPRVLEAWRPPHGGSRVLVTARRGTWPRTLHRVALGLLDRADSVALLVQLCPRLMVAEADGLAADLGDLPLALHLAGSYLATYDHVTVEAYRAQLSLGHPSLQGRGTESLPTKHERDVAHTFALSYDQLDPDNPIDAEARWLLACAACLAPGVPFPRDLLLDMTSEGMPPEDTIDALGCLRALGLLDGDTALILHRLLATFVLSRHDSPAAQMAVEEVFLQKTHGLNRTGGVANVLRWQIHLRTVVNRAAERHDALAADLCNAFGAHLSIIAHNQEATWYLERSLLLYQQLFDSRHPSIASSLCSLALLHQRMSDLSTARTYYEQALAMREMALGAIHFDVSAILIDLGYLLIISGDYRTAGVYLRRSLHLRKQMFGLAHPHTVGILSHLGYLYYQQGYYERAKARMHQALAIRKTVTPTNAIAIAQLLNNIGEVLLAQGMITDARLYHEEALEMRKSIFGHEHNDVAESLWNLGRSLIAEQQYQAADILLNQALTINLRLLGSHHRETALIFDSLGCLAGQQHQYEIAKTYFRNALTTWVGIFGKSHQHTSDTMTNISEMYYYQGDYARATKWATRAMSLQQATLRKTHPALLRSRRLHAAIHQASAASTSTT